MFKQSYSGKTALMDKASFLVNKNAVSNHSDLKNKNNKAYRSVLLYNALEYSLVEGLDFPY